MSDRRLLFYNDSRHYYLYCYDPPISLEEVAKVASSNVLHKRVLDGIYHAFDISTREFVIAAFDEFIRQHLGGPPLRQRGVCSRRWQALPSGRRGDRSPTQLSEQPQNDVSPGRSPVSCGTLCAYSGLGPIRPPGQRGDRQGPRRHPGQARMATSLGRFRR